MTRDISIDLESLSLKNNAMILSIGAVEFDTGTGQILSEFYRVVDIEAAGGGGVIDPSTVVWWMRQNPDAIDAIFGREVERDPLAQVLLDFSEWLGFDDSLGEGEYPDVKLWARGDKDGQWLASAYEGLGLALPYQYWQMNDQRTVTNLFPKEFFDYGDSIAHNALEDARIQAKHLTQALRYIQMGVDVGLVDLGVDLEDVGREETPPLPGDCVVCGLKDAHYGLPCPQTVPTCLTDLIHKPA